MNQRTMSRGRIKTIPPPPGTDDGYDAIIAYFNKYSTEEIEKAGYLEEVSQEELQDLAASATYELLCKHGLKTKLTRKEYKELSCLAARSDVSAESLAKKWIRERLQKEIQSE